MEKARQRKILIGMVVMLGTVLCLLVIIALFFEYGGVGSGVTEQKENTSLVPEKHSATATSGTGEPEGLSVPENTGDGREETFDADMNVNQPSDGKENRDEQEKSNPHEDSESNFSEFEEIETTVTIPVQTEASRPIQGETQENPVPTETETEETTLPDTESAEVPTNRCETDEY